MRGQGTYDEGDLLIQIIQQAQSQALQKSTEGLRSLAHEDDNTDCVLAAAVKRFFPHL